MPGDIAYDHSAMPDPHPLEYQSPLDADHPVVAPIAQRLRPIPRGAHGIACVACLIVFWGNVATYALEGHAAGYDGRPPYDRLWIFWSAIAILGIVYGRMAARATDYRRSIGRVALLLNALLLAGMWAWRFGLLNLFAFRT
jgi:hypothetical protein